VETPTGEFTLEDFEKELKKAPEGCECFIVMTVKRFLHEVNELPSRVSKNLTIRIGIVFGDQLLEFMGIYGDFTRFIAGELFIIDESVLLRSLTRLNDMPIEDDQQRINDIDANPALYNSSHISHELRKMARMEIKNDPMTKTEFCHENKPENVILEDEIKILSDEEKLLKKEKVCEGNKSEN
ncbi:14813_t:CDS:2, partial [Funneliformis geosporum]